MGTENDILARQALYGMPSGASDGELISTEADCAELVVTCSPDHFLASAIARAVEDADAHLLNLNVADARHADGSLMVTLRINRRNPVHAARSLERHGFTVVDGGGGDGSADHSSDYDSILADRANQLLHLLNI